MTATRIHVVTGNVQHWAAKTVGCSECHAGINKPCIDTQSKKMLRLAQNTVHVTRVAANGHNVL